MRVFSIAAGIALLAGPAVPAHASKPVATDILQPVLAAGAPGALLERRDGPRVRTAAAGVADLATGRPARPADRYRIGSNTKTMTAVVVLQLAAQRKLALDAPVDRWLPGLLPDHRITVRHLLQHTSGLHQDQRLWKTVDDVVDGRFRQYAPEELVRAALTNPAPMPPPGTTFEYSNTNYVVLGMLVEKITGNSIGAELRDRIFRPLGLADTYFADGTAYLAGRHLNGYVPLEPGKPLVDFTVYNPSWAWSAGAVVSTVDDQARFLRGLITGRLLPRRWVAQMMDVRGHGYGLGLMPVSVPCVPGGLVWGHNGMVLGYGSVVFSTPDGRTQVAGAETLSHDPNLHAVGVLTDVAKSAFCG
ncbi:serine hydrolase domain-containing protein [Fodinicola acaciae]|uniref:serine hydrolase domain-containing protein n=1 Tax=Fodinicola acaciae TaxID=2681555 RepID=UPI0013D413E2|nr:serine hydrolase domain-containing protein [Fodinicola acaciae]